LGAEVAGFDGWDDTLGGEGFEVVYYCVVLVAVEVDGGRKGELTVVNGCMSSGPELVGIHLDLLELNWSEGEGRL